ncbi:MAG: hypothetical protein HY954_11365 [Deltaproteobacteria bacterium]|nr:hypothetical protein [Deltaproteobacteria bacterium]
MERFESPSQAVKKPDMTIIKSEFREILYFLNRQVFNQIPSVSAVAGLLAGAWVASTFTASPIKGTLAQWGIIKGGTHVVSTGTYRFLTIILPIMATGVTAYIVQKGLKAFREMQIELNESRVARLSEDVRKELNGKLEVLEKAREAGLLSWGEYRTKLAHLYQSYARRPNSRIEDLLINKLTTRIQ